MKLLVLGGTKFLGRGVVEAATAHEVTIANRGKTNPELFPEVERIQVDLSGELDALSGREWDAVVDLDPTQLPRHTRRRAELLRDAVGHYVFTSTISVYADPSVPLDESSPVLEPPDPEPEAFDLELYGNLKVGSERAVQEIFGERCAIVRPGLIVGPHDPTDRFTYWPRRLAEGGPVLAPGRPEQPVQIVDARDLGAFLVHVAESRVSGVFNGTGPAEALTLGETLERIAPGAELVWVDDEALLAAGIGPWMELPLWLPGDEYAGMLRADVSRALAAGLDVPPARGDRARHARVEPRGGRAAPDAHARARARAPRGALGLGLARGGRGRPARVVAVDAVRLAAARVRDVHGEPLEEDDVDDRVTRRHERGVAAERPQGGGGGGGALGGAALALEDERAHRLVDGGEVAVEQLLRLVHLGRHPRSLAQLEDCFVRRRQVAAGARDDEPLLLPDGREIGLERLADGGRAATTRPRP